MPDAGQRAPVRPALIELTLVRLKEFVREPEALFWVFGFPLLLALGLGIAFRNRAPESIRIGVLQSLPSAVAASLDSVPGLSAVRITDDRAGAQALRNADVAVVVAPGANGGVEYRFDPSRPDARTARLLVDNAVQRGAGRVNPLPVSESTISERGARYIDFFIPGLLGLNLMGSGIWSIAFAVVTARKQKLLKRLVATPMSRAQYLMSFLLSRLFFLVIEVGALVGFGALVFDVPVRGSLVALGVVCLIAALTFSAMGLLVASRARTVEAVSGLANLVMLPMWIFSGVFFSAANFPKALQPFIQALPLTGTVDALRAIMLRGASLTTVSGELLLLLGWLVVPFVVALRLFRWR
ncbi:MAG TPA: ABC transporter permease [Gemmatimonadales bacterium]|jgi:ABC-type multidrug transport system permease subunit|nr:ABC transporter permease [Gemmatimonadales bacterium]